MKKILERSKYYLGIIPIFHLLTLFSQGLSSFVTNQFIISSFAISAFLCNKKTVRSSLNIRKMAFPKKLGLRLVNVKLHSCFHIFCVTYQTKIKLPSINITLGGKHLGFKHLIALVLALTLLFFTSP